MRHNNIRGLLKVPGYKIKEIIEKTDQEIHVRLEVYKRNEGRCSGCGKKHGGLHSEQEMIAEDVAGKVSEIYHEYKRERDYGPRRINKQK